MGGLIGPIGGLEELRCASTLSEAPVSDSLLRVSRALDGTEYGQIASARPNREWQIGVGAAPPETMHLLTQLVRAQRWLMTPFVYYSEAAQVENLLEPDVSMMSRQWWSNITDGGARTLPGVNLPGPRFLGSGSAPSDGRWARLQQVPVPALRTMTVSVYLTPYVGRTAQLWVNEINDAGNEGDVHRVYVKDDPDEATHLVRAVVTFESRADTVSLTLAVKDAVTIVAPAITLTRSALDWVEGQGCMNAVIKAPAAREVRLAVPDVSWGRVSSYSWSIREVGRGGIAPGSSIT